MKNIHVLQTAQPSRLFYFNNELRLEHNTVERKTNQNIYITSDEKKRRLFHRKRKIFSTEVPHQYQILLYQEGIKNHPNNRPKLNQRECKPLMMSFWSGSKIQVVRRWRYFIKMFILWVNGIEEVT
jgi:hypothetical protein